MVNLPKSNKIDMKPYLFITACINFAIPAISIILVIELSLNKPDKFT